MVIIQKILLILLVNEETASSGHPQLNPDLEASGALTVDCLDSSNGETWDVGECVPMARHSIFAGKEKIGNWFP